VGGQKEHWRTAHNIFHGAERALPQAPHMASCSGQGPFFVGIKAEVVQKESKG